MATGDQGDYKRFDSEREIKGNTEGIETFEHSVKNAGNKIGKLAKAYQKEAIAADAAKKKAIYEEEKRMAVKTQEQTVEQFQQNTRFEDRSIRQEQIEFRREVYNTIDHVEGISDHDKEIMKDMTKTHSSQQLVALAKNADDPERAHEWAIMANKDPSGEWVLKNKDSLGNKEALAEYRRDEIKRETQANEIKKEDETQNQKRMIDQDIRKMKAENTAKYQSANELMKARAMADAKASVQKKNSLKGGSGAKLAEGSGKGKSQLVKGERTLKKGSAAAKTAAKDGAKTLAKTSAEAKKEAAKEAAVTAAQEGATAVAGSSNVFSLAWGALTGVAGAAGKAIYTVMMNSNKRGKENSDSHGMMMRLGALGLAILIMFMPLLMIVIFFMNFYNPGHDDQIKVPQAVSEVKTAYDNAMKMKMNMYLEGSGLTVDDVSMPAYSLHLKQCVAYWYIVRDADAQREYKYKVSPYLSNSLYIYGSDDSYPVQDQQLLTDTETGEIGYIAACPTPAPAPDPESDEFDEDQELEFSDSYVQSGTEALPLNWATHHAVPRSLGLYIYNYETAGDGTALIYDDSDCWTMDNYYITCSDLYALYNIVRDMNMIMLVPDVEIISEGEPVLNPDTGEYETTYNYVTSFTTESNYRDPVEFAIENNRSEEEIAALQQIVDQEGPVYEEFEHFWKALFRTHLIEAQDYPSQVIGRGMALWSAMGGTISYKGASSNVLERWWNSGGSDGKGTGGSQYKDFYSNRNSRILYEWSKVSDLRDYGYPVNEYDNDDWTIQQYIYRSLGLNWDAAWCAAFISYCFQNGEQGYFDMPYAWTLNVGPDYDLSFTNIDSYGVYGSYEARIQALQEVEENLVMVCGSGSVTAPSDGGTQVALYTLACQTMADVVGQPAREMPSGVNPYEEYNLMADLYEEMVDQTNEQRLNTIYNWATWMYDNCSDDENIEIMISAGILPSGESFDFSSADEILRFKTEIVEYFTSYLNSQLVAPEGQKDADTAAGKTLCYQVGQCAFETVQNSYMGRDDFVWWTSSVKINSGTDAGFVFWSYARDNDWTIDMIQNEYDKASFGGAYEPGDTMAQFAWMSSSSDWARSWSCWRSYGWDCDPYDLYLHTSNWHVALVDKVHSCGNISPFGGNCQYTGYVNWYRCFYDGNENKLNMMQQCRSTTNFAPWDPDYTLFLQTDWEGCPGGESYGYPLDFMWAPYEDDTSWVPFPSGEMVQPSSSYNDMENSIWGIYEHEEGKYIPYYDAWATQPEDATALYRDDQDGKSVTATAGFFDIAYFFGANAATYRNKVLYPDGPEIFHAPLYDLFREITPQTYGIFQTSPGCSVIMGSQIIKDDLIDAETFVDGGNVLQAGDILCYSNAATDHGHIKIVVDRWYDTVTSSWYIITLEGNSGDTCRLSIWSESAYIFDYDSSFWVGNSGDPLNEDNHYHVYRVFDDVEMYN